MFKKISKFFWLGLINGLLLFSHLSCFMQTVIYFPPEYRVFKIVSKIVFAIYFIVNFIIYLKFTKDSTKPKTKIKEFLLITGGIISGYALHAIKSGLAILAFMYKISIPKKLLIAMLPTSFLFDIEAFAFQCAIPIITYLAADFIRLFIKYLIKKNKQLEEDARKKRQNGSF